MCTFVRPPAYVVNSDLYSARPPRRTPQALQQVVRRRRRARRPTSDLLHPVGEQGGAHRRRLDARARRRACARTRRTCRGGLRHPRRQHFVASRPESGRSACSRSSAAVHRLRTSARADSTRRLGAGRRRRVLLSDVQEQRQNCRWRRRATRCPTSPQRERQRVRSASVRIAPEGTHRLSEMHAAESQRAAWKKSGGRYSRSPSDRVTTNARRPACPPRTSR